METVFDARLCVSLTLASVRMPALRTAQQA